MELREFAEQVLFANTLEGKLQCPDILTDESPGSPRLCPSAPGRPPELQFKPPGGDKADFPDIRHLENDRERGHLLHFFANHELLATELMALVLLKFPAAPPAFRRGVLQTLREEQTHTRLYLNRMRECGCRFGELPVSGYFWRAVSPMQNPMDYVASLSLTFEQANLDFCRHFAKVFEAAADGRTARLLEHVYRDEIGHVAYGLKWFRRWKDPQQSDWEAFCRQLRFPLSPQRAKGISLNIPGRQAAGFDPEFIAELNVYAQSKGRTPSVFVFNPFTEGYIAQGQRFTPTQYQAQLASDLQNLPQFLCRQDDLVLLEKRPSAAFLSAIKQAGFPLPEFVECANLMPRVSRADGLPPALRQVPRVPASLERRKLSRLRPWAWGPESARWFEPLMANVSAENRSGTQSFNPLIAQLYAKSWSADFLRTWLRSQPQRTAVPGPPPNPVVLGAPSAACAEPWLCTEHEVGKSAGTLEEALEAISAIRARGHHRIVVKQDYGLAGHNSIRLWEPEVLAPQWRWMKRALQNGIRLVIEPWLERELDFSVQFEMEPGGLKLLGYTGLLNDHRGQYQANWAAPNCSRHPPAALLNCFPQSDRSFRLQGLYADIRAALEPELQRAGYNGPLGIDAFVYRTPAGARCLKPIVEINPRYTMGRLTLELMKRTCPGSYGVVRLIPRAAARREGFADFAAQARALTERHPLRLEGAPIPRIREGMLCLNEPSRAQVCLATFRVSGTDFVS